MTVQLLLPKVGSLSYFSQVPSVSSCLQKFVLLMTSKSLFSGETPPRLGGGKKQGQSGFHFRQAEDNENI